MIAETGVKLRHRFTCSLLQTVELLHRIKYRNDGHFVILVVETGGLNVFISVQSTVAWHPKDAQLFS